MLNTAVERQQKQKKGRLDAVRALALSPTTSLTDVSLDFASTEDLVEAVNEGSSRNRANLKPVWSFRQAASSGSGGGGGAGGSGSGGGAGAGGGSGGAAGLSGRAGGGGGGGDGGGPSIMGIAFARMVGQRWRDTTQANKGPDRAVPITRSPAFVLDSAQGLLNMTLTGLLERYAESGGHAGSGHDRRKRGYSRGLSGKLKQSFHFLSPGHGHHGSGPAGGDGTAGGGASGAGSGAGGGADGVAGLPPGADRSSEFLHTDKIFGTDLTTVAALSGFAFPRILHEAIVHLHANELRTQGLFRKSGSASRIRDLISKCTVFASTRYDTGAAEGDRLTFSNYNAHDVAGVIKQWFRELPEALLTKKMSQAFLSCSRLPHPSLQEQGLAMAVALLPGANRDVLQVLLYFLAQIARASETTADGEEGNLMTASNLAVIFAPNLFYIATKRVSVTHGWCRERRIEFCCGLIPNPPSVLAPGPVPSGNRHPLDRKTWRARQRVWHA